MNAPIGTTPAVRRSACPHDCPSTCALEVEVLDGRHIGRVRGARENDYTAGVICAKVARYKERAEHPDRILHPLVRTGPKGSGDFRQVSWEEALDRIGEAFLAAEARNGPAAVFPYHYAGTMGLVQRDGIHRLRHAKDYSRQHDTICTNMAWTGFVAGTGRLAGPDPREMRKSDLVVIWGTNAVATQINVMAHAVHARKSRGARIAVVDVYETETMRQADIPLIVRPGSDGALACAVMHVLFRDGLADRDYLAAYADDPAGLEAHLQTRTPDWAAPITGLRTEEIEAFARAIGETPRTYLRVGYGFTRCRNGTVNMHAATSIATVAGAWQHEGGGAFHNNGGIYVLDGTMTKGTDVARPGVRSLDQSRIGDILLGDPDVLACGPPVEAMLIQNTNPVSVAPNQSRVKAGFQREDLFVAVHEQFMTETARMADVILPATMFVEHDDVYKGGGHSYIILGPKLVDPPGECRSNHAVLGEIADRVGAEHPGFGRSARDLIDDMLVRSGLGSLAALETIGWIDCQPDFETAHYTSGFAWPDGKFRFRPDWASVPSSNRPADGRTMGPVTALPPFPDHVPLEDPVTPTARFRLVTAPAHSFLNSTFNETASSQKREQRPTVLIHPDDATTAGIADGAAVELSNGRGSVRLHAAHFEGVQRGVLISEGLWPNDAFPDGAGINTLVGSDPIAPYGGAAFHDNSVAVRPVVG